MSLGQPQELGYAKSTGPAKDHSHPEEMVMVTHVESANSMWAQMMTDDNLSSLLEMTEQLQTLCPAAPKLSGPYELNKIYGAQFSEDQQWYRCKVKQSFGTDMVKVFYVDYGNTEEINPSELVVIPGNVSLVKPFAVRLALNNLRMQDVHDKKATAFLKKQVMREGKYLRAVMKRKLSDNSGYFTDIYADTVSVNNLMVEEGHAMFRVEMKRHMEGTQSYPPIERENGTGDAHVTSRMGGDAYSDLHRKNFDLAKQKPYSNAPSGYTAPVRHDVPKQNVPDLRPELNAKTQELLKIKMEKEKITGELVHLKSRMKVLQSEFTVMRDSSTNTQFHTALELAASVRKLRCQFPTLENTPLDCGLKLCNGDKRVDNSMVKTLPRVVSTVSDYRSAQKEICILTDMTQLDHLMEVRNSARTETVNVLTDCLHELDLLPLAERKVCLNDTLMKIRKYYDSYFKFSIHSCPSLKDLLPTFLEWKQKRMSDFTEARTTTDCYQEIILSTLTSIKSNLSFTNLEDFEKNDCDFEATLRQYIQGLQHEISVTDAEHSSDAGFLAALVQSLSTELQTEVTTIEHFQRLYSEFATMKEECEQWLDEKPNVSDLQKVRKTLRGLKSKLRHRVADREDFEDNEDDASMLEEINTDISEIRREIHNALSIEDDLLNQLAKVADIHFPELMKIHPEMGIDIYLEFNGLVKTSHEIDHFDLKHVTGGRHGLFESTFSGKPVLIRELLLKDGDRLDKDTFIKEVVAYSENKEECLQSIQSVFFDKNARHAYICTPKTGKLLINIVEEKQVDQRGLQTIVRCIAQSLNYLHSHKIVHGEVTPQNIIVQENGSAVLLVPDFSQTMKERSRQKYSTPSGVVFEPPELKNVMLKDVFPATDMFNLGLLTLWLRYQDVHFSLKDDAPDFSSVPLEKPLQIVISSLLHGLPHLRPTSCQLLSSDYLTQSIPDVPPPVAAPLQIVAPQAAAPLQVVAPLQIITPQVTAAPLQIVAPQPAVASDLPASLSRVSPPSSHASIPASLSPVQSLNNVRDATPTSEEDVMANIGAFDASCLNEFYTDKSTDSGMVNGGELVSQDESAVVSSTPERTPGLKEMMSGHASPASFDKVSLADVLSSFSQKNSFLKDENTHIGLSTLLNGLDQTQ